MMENMSDWTLANGQSWGAYKSYKIFIVQIYWCPCGCVTFIFTVFEIRCWNDGLHREQTTLCFCTLPSTHTLAVIVLIVRDKKCWVLITPGSVCGMFEAGTFVPSPDIKTHMRIRCDGCIITAMTSHPIDKTDGRQDSWQHGTKLVWAAVPSAVCCHDRGGSYYLHGCPSISAAADWLGAGQWKEAGWGGGAAWVSCKWKDGLIRTQPLPLFSFLCPLWQGD